MAGKQESNQLIERILALEEKVYQALRPLGPQQWFRISFTMPQLKAMLLLFADGPTRMSTLSSRLGVSLSTTTGIVQRLVRQGFVLRQSLPGDRRVVVCRLSQKGQKAMERLWESKQIWARNLLEKMPISKLQVIAEAMEAILEAVTTAEPNSQQAIH